MFYEDRPKIILPKDQTQKAIEIIIFLCIAFCFIYPAIYYTALPEQVPMHFNYKGEVDKHGSKDSVFVLAIIAAITSFVIFKLNKYPHVFNYTVKITQENAAKQYKDAVKMLTYVNLLIAILFVIICYQIVNIALANGNQFGQWSEYLIYIIIATITVGPILLALINVFKND